MEDNINKRAEEIGKESAYPMTKLELFSAMAMQGHLANNKYLDGDFFDGEALASDSITCAHALCMALAEKEASNV